MKYIIRRAPQKKDTHTHKTRTHTRTNNETNDNNGRRFSDRIGGRFSPAAAQCWLPRRAASAVHEAHARSAITVTACGISRVTAYPVYAARFDNRANTAATAADNTVPRDNTIDGKTERVWILVFKYRTKRILSVPSKVSGVFTVKTHCARAYSQISFELFFLIVRKN